MTSFSRATSWFSPIDSAQMRDTCVAGRPLSLAQALICACAALRSFLDVPVALIGTGGFADPGVPPNQHQRARDHSPTQDAGKLINGKRKSFLCIAADIR